MSEAKQPQREEQKTRGAYRGGRGRGGAGAAAEGGDRPRTTHTGERRERKEGDKPLYQKRKEGGEDRREGGDKPRKEQDKDSWVYKFHYMERPKYEKIEVTLETEVPAPIPKENRKKQPDRTEFDNKMRAIDAQIESLKGKSQAIITKKKETLEGGKMKGSQVTFKDFLKGKSEDISILRETKKGLHSQADALKAKIEERQRERDNIQKNLPQERHMQNPEALQKLIDDLQRRYETTTLKAGDEKKIMAEIKKYKDNIPNAKRLQELKPIIDELYAQKKVVSAQIGELKTQIEAKSAELDAVRKELDEAREQKDEINSQLDKFNADYDKVKADITALYAQKDQLREDHHKARLEFELEQDLIRHNDWISHEKERLLARDKAREQRLAERKAQLANRPNPYEKEIEVTENLIKYCDHLRKKLGLVQTEESIKEETKQLINQFAKEDVKKKLEDRKIEQVMSKKEREEAAMIKVGGGKKGGKKPKVKAEEQEDPFQNIDIGLLKEFGFLKVSPPTDKSQLEAKLAELNSKLQEYVKLGEERLRAEEEQVMAGTIEETPEEHHQEAEERHHYGGGRGGRGGRGGFRGGRGGRGGNRGGRPAGGDRRREEDDDVYVSSGDEGNQQHKAVKRAANKKENLALDDNNYPTL